MKRTKKSKGKQEKPIKVQQVNKTAELQPTQTGNKCIPAAVGAAIIIFGLNYFFMFSSDFKTLNENAYNLSLFVSIAVSLSAIAGICYGKNKTFQSVLKYVFALLLLFQIIPQSLLFIDTSEFGANFATHIVMLQKFLLIPLAALGVILLWVLRKKNITEPNTIKSQNLALKTIFSKPGKQTFSASIAFIIILGISAGAVFHKLDYFSLYSDEAQVTHAAVGFAKSGEFKKWDFVKDEISDRTYTRAWPHIAVMGYTYRLFGISDWTSRLPSAVFGLLLTVLGFFITRFFTKSTLTALIVMLSFGLYFEFLLLTRWARMYAMIFPLFLLMLYFGYRIFTEPLTTKEKISGKLGRFFNEYLNFNYKLLPVFLILLFINISLHNNTAIALPILYLFLIISGLIYREKKFIIPVLIGLLIIISHLISPFLFGYGHITAFEIDNSDIYNRFFLGYPFNVEAGMALLIMGLTYFFFRKNKALNNAYILLYTATVFSWILFAYIIDFSISFRYMSMVAPFCVILLIGLFLQISKDIFGKKVQYAAALSVVGLIILNLSVRSNNLYVRNYVSPADPAMAWKKITKN